MLKPIKLSLVAILLSSSAYAQVLSGGLGGGAAPAGAANAVQVYGTSTKLANPTTSLILGTGTDAASPSPLVISFQNALAGTSNAAGALTTFNGSNSTGNANGGGFSFNMAWPGASGTANNTYHQILGMGINSGNGGGQITIGNQYGPSYYLNGFDGLIFSQSGTTNDFHVGTNNNAGGGQAFSAASTNVFGFTPTGNADNSPDTAISRVSANVLAVGNGAPGDASGTVKAASVVTGALTYATLPASPTAGQRAFITDSTLAYNGTNLGATAAGGSTNKSPVYYNGTAWLIGG